MFIIKMYQKIDYHNNLSKEMTVHAEWIWTITQTWKWSLEEKDPTIENMQQMWQTLR